MLRKPKVARPLDTLTLDAGDSGPPSSAHPESAGALEPPGAAGVPSGALMRSPASFMSSPGTPLSALLASGMPGDEDVDEEAETYDVDEEDMHAVGIPAARGWRLDPRYVRVRRAASGAACRVRAGLGGAGR